jgi:hypothetical protein
MPVHMRDSRLRFAAALTVLGCFLFAAVAVLASQSPTLGELALKEQERRKALKVAGRVLTEQDLPAAGPHPVSSAPSAAVKDGSPGQAPVPPTEARDESWWRQRIVQVRDSVRRNEVIAEALQARINALTNDFAARDDPYQRTRIADDRQKASAELDRVRSEITVQKKKIEDIEEEARRAGVPSGWLR